MASGLLGLPATAGLASMIGFIVSFLLMSYCIFKLHARWSRRRGPASATDWAQVGAALGLSEAPEGRFNLGGVVGQVGGLAVEAGAQERLEARTWLSVRLPAPLRPPLVISPRFGVGVVGEGRLSDGFEVTSSGRPQSGQVLSQELSEALRGCWQAGVPIAFDGQAVTLEIQGVGLEAAGLIATLGLMLAVGERLQRHFAAREEARGRATLVLGASSRAGEVARWARLAHRAGLTPLPGGGGMTGALDGQEVQVIEQTRGDVATFVNTLGVSGGARPQTVVEVPLRREAGFEVRLVPTLQGGRSTIYLGDHTFDLLYALQTEETLRTRALLVAPLRDQLVKLARLGAPASIQGRRLVCRLEGVGLEEEVVLEVARAAAAVAAQWCEACDALDRCIRQAPWALDEVDGATLREPPRSCRPGHAVLSLEEEEADVA